MSEFKREQRYVVLKIKDIESAGVTLDELTKFNIVCDKVSLHRIGAGKGLLNCVVVEHDWSIYEQVWKLVEECWRAKK